MKSTDISNTSATGVTTAATRGRTSRRASLSQSKLRRPDSVIYSLAAQFQDYMYLPDPTALYVTMGMLAGNMISGHPLWMMLVGSSGSGKTHMLKSLGLVPHTRRVSSIEGKAALLSGVKKKERAADATGGLLREMQWGDMGPDARGYGCIVFLEFMNILSMQRDGMKIMMTAFRDIYDEEWEREIGGEGGRKLYWRGKIGMITGVTHMIDEHQEETAIMGERFLYFRFGETDGYQESVTAANSVHPRADDEARQQLVAGALESLGLSFEHPKPARMLENVEINRLVAWAQFGARARSPVSRDKWSPTREVKGVITPEVATRVTVGLAQLYRGCEEIGLDEEDRWAVIKRVAMDSIPLTRGCVLKAVITGGAGGKEKPGVSSMEVARAIRCGETTVKRELDNLQLLGVVEKGERGWRVTEWTKERVGS